MTNQTSQCSIEKTLKQISGKWKSVIIYMLLKYPVCRFSELQRLIPDCSRRMLALQLKELEQDGLITKKVYPVTPPKTEYSLTERGKDLRMVVEGMQEWGKH
ncbi:winged helix-turn-helix transcriptional regulator [Limosilactobacillus agrestimuris]|uniref:winged helix-turn-helix transcriptional regulator n=1 Tax=Limosilactobacillus agrestimuris TaxID=2941331 RepID=UPI00203B4C61|nr:helix-turn-helix domain-containing protein [Limosilactobacillus agrestimuris]